ncbi:hypothetical protein HII31_11513 [Pseudocercospora fuligena]|uniref:BTB domain-containing protein n=1 Tax=Pseudocercospora fuligena TaxID=685502 RepID=A0A8H6RB02_9PEZI|nr:hypothetical protein HII31_11513 [Pseudocercospora fuligena]
MPCSWLRFNLHVARTSNGQHDISNGFDFFLAFNFRYNFNDDLVAIAMPPAGATKSVFDTSLPTTPDAQHTIDDHYDQAITIFVGRGSGAKGYDIHRGLLKFYSGYFRTAIKNAEHGEFMEGKKGVIELWEESRLAHVSAIRYAYENTAKGSALRRLLVFCLANEKKSEAGEEQWPPKDRSSWFLDFAEDLTVHRISGAAIPTQHSGVFGGPSVTSMSNWNRCAYHVHDTGKNCGNPGWKVIN